MASRYQFSNEEIKEIEPARKNNKDKRAEARLKTLEYRVKGASANEAAEATGFHAGSVTRLAAKYRGHGIEAIAGNHYGGNHRNMSVVEISEITKAYQSAAAHPVSKGQIYRVLHGHGWRKVMPRSRHPQKTSEEEIAASKK